MSHENGGLCCRLLGTFRCMSTVHWTWSECILLYTYLPEVNTKTRPRLLLTANLLEAGKTVSGHRLDWNLPTQFDSRGFRISPFPHESIPWLENKVWIQISKANKNCLPVSLDRLSPDSSSVRWASKGPPISYQEGIRIPPFTVTGCSGLWWK